MTSWTVWTNHANTQTSLVRGDGAPRFADGTLDPGVTRLLWKIEAATYEEAQAIHHLRLGWHPYKPAGDPAPCPSCGAMFYPDGSGECQCGAATR